MKKIILTILFSILISNYSYAVVSTSAPASSSTLNSISGSLSYSALNPSNVINNSNNITSNLISTTDLKKDIKETASKLDLKVDDEAVEILSSVSSDASSQELGEVLDKMDSNLNEDEFDDDYVMTKDQDTIMYDSGWFNLERVETGSNGLTYNKPGTSDVFADVVQQARGKVYVNFNKKEISADMFTKITLKGASQVNHEWNSGTAGITSIPVVADTVRGLKTDGTTAHDEFVGIQSSMQIDADTLAPNYDPGFTKQQLMDFYNHDTSNGDADKRLFFYGKFTTVDSSGTTGIGSIIVEGAHDANADATDAGTTTYIGTIERLEGSGTIVGKAMN